ncbi:hypothetical protein M9991_12435 [Chryseobacterium gallinarum]|uniref:hypothetical protein n=1 Tax=Chryseobacterium gallinarum TaxID=1324352 RepID=UPI002024E5C0|nr:hypothetical protein [Chryseobacterium gallinarum]MCL8537672.1 hypothetical protein [Chryseobacterium gallinarum]
MKMKNIGIYGGALVALIIAGTTMSFNAIGANGAKKAPKAAVTYYYISDDMAEGAFKDPVHWNINNNSEPCESDGKRPCAITVPDGSSLSAVLGSRTNAQVLQISEGFKPAP